MNVMPSIAGTRHLHEQATSVNGDFLLDFPFHSVQFRHLQNQKADESGICLSLLEQHCHIKVSQLLLL